VFPVKGIVGVGRESQASDERHCGEPIRHLHDLGGSLAGVFIASIAVARGVVVSQHLGKLEEGTEYCLLKRAVLMREGSGEDLDFVSIGTIHPLGERLRHLLSAVLRFHLALLPAHLSLGHFGFAHGSVSLVVEQSIGGGDRSQALNQLTHKFVCLAHKPVCLGTKRLDALEFLKVGVDVHPRHLGVIVQAAVSIPLLHRLQRHATGSLKLVGSPAHVLGAENPLDLFLSELGEQELGLSQPRLLAVAVMGVSVLGLLSESLSVGHVCFLVG